MFSRVTPSPCPSSPGVQPGSTQVRTGALVLSPAHHRSRLSDSVKNGNALMCLKERKKTEVLQVLQDNPREGWEDGTPPPHRDFKEKGVVL